MTTHPSPQLIKCQEGDIHILDRLFNSHLFNGPLKLVCVETRVSTSAETLSSAGDCWAPDSALNQKIP